LAYNKTNPNDIILENTDKNAYILLYTSIFIILLAYVNVYVAEKFKIYAAATGSITIFDIVTFPFRF